MELDCIVRSQRHETDIKEMFRMNNCLSTHITKRSTGRKNTAGELGRYACKFIKIIVGKRRQSLPLMISLKIVVG